MLQQRTMTDLDLDPCDLFQGSQGNGQGCMVLGRSGYDVLH
jgi:hypothetical protein